MAFIQNMHPAAMALVAGLFTWFCTLLGASPVLFAKSLHQKALDAMLGFAGGVMMAASYWSLLEPALALSRNSQLPHWLPPACGFLAGAAFLSLLDKILPHLHIGFPLSEAEGVKTKWPRSTLLTLAVTLHNIPEGLAVGVAFGAVASGLPEASLSGAMALTLGIAIQNIPEGIAVAAPLYRDGLSRMKSFWYGQLSAAVEPVAAVAGAAAVIIAKPLLPYALSFAAGAMIFVVVEEVIPEAQRHGNTDLATGGSILGFLVMMILDVALA